MCDFTLGPGAVDCHGWRMASKSRTILRPNPTIIFPITPADCFQIVPQCISITLPLQETKLRQKPVFPRLAEISLESGPKSRDYSQDFLTNPRDFSSNESPWEGLGFIVPSSAEPNNERKNKYRLYLILQYFKPRSTSFKISFFFHLRVNHLLSHKIYNI